MSIRDSDRMVPCILTVYSICRRSNPGSRYSITSILYYGSSLSAFSAIVQQAW